MKLSPKITKLIHWGKSSKIQKDDFEHYKDTLLKISDMKAEVKNLKSAIKAKEDIIKDSQFAVKSLHAGKSQLWYINNKISKQLKFCETVAKLGKEKLNRSYQQIANLKKGLSATEDLG